MRTGLIVSGTAHAALIAWGVVALTSMAPLDSSSIEQIPVDFVEVADTTKLTKGIETAAVLKDVPPPPVAKPKEEPPKPVPPPEPPKPDPAPTPPAPPPPPPPPPTPPAPPPPPEDQPEAPPPPATPSPEAETPPPPDEVAVAPPKDVPLPRVRPKMPVKPDTSTSDLDQIQALLDKRRLDEMAAATEAPPEAPAQAPPSVGSPDASATDVKMTANELELLRSRLARCWSPPLGWTDPTEVRVVLMLSLNQDGSVSGQPQVLEAPRGQYAQTAPESAIRAVIRCAPYNLPPEKYDAWKEVRVTFDPRDMGAT